MASEYVTGFETPLPLQCKSESITGGIRRLHSSSLLGRPFDRPNVSHRLPEWQPSIPVELDVVVTNVRLRPLECINSKTGVSSHWMGKPSAPNLSPSQASSLTLLDMYRLLLIADIVIQANALRSSIVVNLLGLYRQCSVKRQPGSGQKAT